MANPDGNTIFFLHIDGPKDSDFADRVEGEA